MKFKRTVKKMKNLFKFTDLFQKKSTIKDDIFYFLKENYSIQHFSFINGSELTLDKIALRVGTNVDKLGEEISSFLGVWYFPKLKVPRTFVTSSNEADLIPLYSNGSILQRYKDKTDSWFMVYSSPFRLENSSLKKPRIKFALSTQSEIDRIWSEIYFLKDLYNRSNDQGEAWKAVLALCILDAKEMGASEIVFGKGGLDTYEFKIGEGKYSGNIDPLVRKNVYYLLKNNKEEDLSKEISFDRKISFLKDDSLRNDVFIIKLEGNQKSENKENGADPTVMKIDNRINKTSPPHILLIDDDLRFAELLKKGMIAKGFSVSIATSVNDALRYHLESDVLIDLVITDLHMPSGSGTDIIEIVRKNRQDLPVIVLTSDDAIDTQVGLLRCGGDAVVRKGDDPRVLLAWVFRLLERNTSHGTTSSEDISLLANLK